MTNACVHSACCRCMRAGMNGCLTKPISVAGLDAAITSALYQSRGGDASAATPPPPSTNHESSYDGGGGGIELIIDGRKKDDAEGSTGTQTAEGSSESGSAAYVSSSPARDIEGGAGSPAGAHTTSEARGAPRPLRCLVADDNLFNREVTVSLLEALGHSVEGGHAENGADAVAKFEAALADGAPFDVVLMDVMMPVLDGKSATECIRKAERAAGGAGGHRAFVIAATAAVVGDELESCLHKGMDAYLSKPLGIKVLQEALAERFANQPSRA